MKEFKPSDDFVTRVMGRVRAHGDSPLEESGLWDRMVGSRLFRYGVSGSGVFFGIFFSAAVCV